VELCHHSHTRLNGVVPNYIGRDKFALPKVQKAIQFYHYVLMCLHDVQPDAKAKDTRDEAYATMQ
jgi:hypothetical protein